MKIPFKSSNTKETQQPTKQAARPTAETLRRRPSGLNTLRTPAPTASERRRTGSIGPGGAARGTGKGWRVVTQPVLPNHGEKAGVPVTCGCGLSRNRSNRAEKEVECSGEGSTDIGSSASWAAFPRHNHASGHDHPEGHFPRCALL